ncbi:hypothetical protein NE237_021965 [Protea cynaroides]|uniref:Bifunctional inhibitor/plant lipid transfer protein/seed storage helical domain-containing protein n=1 Tax=Protea cynaroides TaxID=273540 RepID=A0A9Q0HA43_9MAGN|nr:hypothetical protein NE237_021965 [Protea cynaroides]
MDTKVPPYFAVVCVLVMLLLLGGGRAPVAAVTCQVSQLSVCASAILQSGAPTTICCAKLKEQEPCLCTYFKDPKFRKYFNSPNAKKVATVCSVPFPHCS